MEVHVLCIFYIKNDFKHNWKYSLKGAKSVFYDLMIRILYKFL